MRFADKLFLFAFLIAASLGLGVTLAARAYMKTQARLTYVAKCSLFADSLGHTLNQLESNAETLLYGVGRAVVLDDDQHGPLPTGRLKGLRDELGVTHLFIIDAKGRFIRSTNEDPNLIPNLYSFCPKYADLVTGRARSMTTPIIPPNPEPKPFKFLTLPNRARTRLIEVGLRVDFIGKVLSKGAASERPGAPPEVFLLSSLLDSVVTEKRLQFRSRIGVEIENRVDAASYGLFAMVQAVEFKRLISNLVNNAVEALGDEGTVTVRLVAQADRLRLEVQDTGKGIPPEILAKLGARGETHGKAGGLGLGLYHARASAESWGGSLELQSETGRGTTAILNLPQARPPEWFVCVLELDPRRPVVVLDDDTSIHQVWQGRFDSLRPTGQALEVLHFSTPAELRGWVKADAARARGTVYLMDYELLGHQDTGLSLIAELGLGERAILVTSRFEEDAILAECLRLQARMIPTGLAGFVPIRVRPAAGAGEPGPDGRSARLDAALIDDDALSRMTWNMAAKRAGKTLQTYADAAAFLADLDAGSIPADTPVYIDSSLADGVKGEDAAREIARRGFKEIRLATGHEPSSFPAMAHIREVVGKTPPWGLDDADRTPG